MGRVKKTWKNGLIQKMREKRVKTENRGAKTPRHVEKAD